MKRLFAFGCSFTQYIWPTWADLLGRDIDYFENWGLQGGGNQFIFASLMECLIKHKFTDGDQIIIMWTNVAREDRYVNNHWLPCGNIYTQNVYNKEFIKNFADPKGYLIKDLALIHAAKKTLDQYGIPYIFTSMMPINTLSQYGGGQIDNTHDILTSYKETIESIRPSVFESIFDSNWGSRPLEVGKHQGYFGNRSDAHPTPMEHLEYITKIMPEFTITDEIKIWAELITQRIKNNQSYDNLWDKNKSKAIRW